MAGKTSEAAAIAKRIEQLIARLPLVLLAHKPTDFAATIRTKVAKAGSDVARLKRIRAKLEAVAKLATARRYDNHDTRNGLRAPNEAAPQTGKTVDDEEPRAMTLADVDFAALDTDPYALRAPPSDSVGERIPTTAGRHIYTRPIVRERFVPFRDDVPKRTPGAIRAWREGALPGAEPTLAVRYARYLEESGAGRRGSAINVRIGGWYQRAIVPNGVAHYSHAEHEEYEQAISPAIRNWHVIEDVQQCNGEPCEACRAEWDEHPRRDADGWIVCPWYPVAHVAALLGQPEATIRNSLREFNIEILAHRFIAYRDFWTLYDLMRSDTISDGETSVSVASAPTARGGDLSVNQVIGELVIRASRRGVAGGKWERECLCLACADRPCAIAGCNRGVCWRREDRLKRNEVTSCGCLQRDQRARFYAKKPRRRRAPRSAR